MTKTEFLVLTSSFLKQHFNDLNISVGNCRIAPSINARNLGVIFDNHMSFDKQINSICKSAFFYLRNIPWLLFVLTIATPCYMVCLILLCFDCKKF